MAGPLVVFSHLRWTWVWQRPQHLLSRLARRRPVYFVEEPVAAEVPQPALRVETQRAVRRVWMDVPRGVAADAGAFGAVAFDDPRAAGYGEQVARLLAPARAEVAWISTPRALEHARALEACTLVYAVMEETAAVRHPITLDAADLVVTAGVAARGGPRARGKQGPPRRVGRGAGALRRRPPAFRSCRRRCRTSWRSSALS